ncbi:MAG TPA: type II secretion system F family protein [Acidimicrobiia bacterium]|nr:type II secretion system F family protein [Acidimicrobiia bacterium]
MNVTAPAFAALSTLWLARRARRADVVDRARALRATGSRLPARLREVLDGALRAADVELDAPAALQLWLLGIVAAGCLAAGLDIALAPIAMVAVLVGAPVSLYGARHRGERRAADELPVVLELVASELRTGGTVGDSLASVTGRPVGGRRLALAPDVERVVRRCELGAPVDEALAAWAAERADAGVRSAAGALAVAATTGGRAAAALDGLAASLRDRREIAAEARALSAQARLSAVVVGCLPIGYLVGCALLDPRQVRVLLHTGFGALCLVIGLVLETLAVVWIRFILREEA